MNRARLGFIGAGRFIQTHHLLTARHSERMTIHTIADLNEDLLAGYARRFPGVRTTTDYRRLLADPDVDVVVIGTKQDLHARLIVESLDAGKWVFCEKPMADTDAEAKAVIEAERRNPGRLAIGFNRRFAPAYRRARALLRRLPRPWFVHYRLMMPTPDKNEGFYADQPRILYEGTHILDLLCWLFDGEPTRLYMTGDRHRNNCCILEFEDGSNASLMCGSLGSYTFWKEYLEAFGDYGAISVSDFIDMRVRGFAGESDALYPTYFRQHQQALDALGFDFYETHRAATLPPPAREYARVHGMSLEPVRRPAYRGEGVDPGPGHPDAWTFVPDKGWAASLEHFVGCFLDGGEPENCHGRDGARATRLALALLESLELGQPVTPTAARAASV